MMRPTLRLLRRCTSFATVLSLAACGGGGNGPGGSGGQAGSAGGTPVAGSGGLGGSDSGAGGGGTPGGGSAGEGSSGGGAQGALRSLPGQSRYALVGDEVVLDGSDSSGATEYKWFFGNGEGWDAPQAEPVARVRYDEPGRYQAVLTVYDAAGNQHAAGVTISVTHPSTHEGTYSRTLAPLPSSGVAVAVSADADQLVVLDRDAQDGFSVSRRIATCDNPRTVSVWRDYIATACQGADRVALYPIAGGDGHEIVFPYGSAPFGVAASETALFASLQGTGKLAEIRLVGGVPALHTVHDAITDARAVAVLPDGRVGVTRWRSPNERGEIAIVDPAGGARTLMPLAFDEQVASDAEIGGVPSYLAELAVAPTGREAVVPSLMANVAEGAFKSGRALTFETTVRAALSRVDLTTGTEDFARRIQFDELGLAGAVAFSSHGDFAYVVMPANRAVARVDLLTGVDAGAFIDAGFAPDGALLTADDRFLLVNASLSREVAVYTLDGETLGREPAARVRLLEREPLAANVLLGKQLFNDAADTRLAKSGYIACSHCHLDGDSDLRVWDFTDRGEGLRNTISLLGTAGGDGAVHWSANFDEIQDFEHDIRGAFGGTGLLTDAQFMTGTRNTTLGDVKAGVSADLDALAAYVESLATERRSPFRTPEGNLTPAALRGKALFESTALRCTTCHSGPRLTDSRAGAQPLLHDVGTLVEGSGKRLGGALAGLDTPTLHGLWHSAPYLHDGSAATLDAVIRARNPNDRHGTTTQLSTAERADLVAYLLSLDGRLD